MLGPAQSASVCQARREFVANAFAVAFSRSAQAEIAIEQAAEALPGLASGARLNAPWSGARTSAKSSSLGRHSRSGETLGGVTVPKAATEITASNQEN